MKQFKNTFALILFGASLAISPHASAQLYSCKSADGRNSYVSDPESCVNSRAVLQGQKKSKKSSKSKASSSNKSPGRLPRVSTKKQSALDKKRAQVLMYEYKSEVNAYRRLAEAITETAPNEERLVDILEKERDEHRRNIIAIRQELARLGVDASNPSN